MKTKKREHRRGGGPPAVAVAELPAPQPHWHYFALGAFVAAVLALWAYWPSMNGPFLFDDNFLPFAVSDISTQPLSAFLHGQRPLLMASYWLSARLSPNDTWWFHFLNLVIHCVTSGLVFFIVRRLLVWANMGESRRGLLAGFAAALFLLHPAQTEAVSYIAGRSDGLSVMFAYAAFVVFLYRPKESATWQTSLAVLVLFGAALTAKEDTIALPALLLLTDLWWSKGSPWEGVRRNWKIYLPLVIGSLVGVAFFWNLITHATTAGFGLKDFAWYQYFFTEWRAVFAYLGIFLWPANLTLDWNFPISHTVLQHGAILWLVALLALMAAAWKLRHRFPLASYGFFAFLILLAPTSSILPIKDPVAERRIYFAMIGLLLIVVDFVARLKVDRQALTVGALVLLLVAGFATHARAEVWSDEISIWQDTVSKSPDASRPHFQLGFAYYKAQRYREALQEFAKTAELHPAYPDLLLLDWGLAYDSLNQLPAALEKLKESAALNPTAQVYSQIGEVYGKQENWPEALAALDQAKRLDPSFPDTYVYLGKVHFKTNQLMAAFQDYQRALQLDPNNTDARHDLQALVNQMRAGSPNK